MTRLAVLVTGRAGFMGGHTCKALAKVGDLPVVCDDLSNGVQDALRYFNAAGVDPDGELGENHRPETPPIPLVLQAAHGKRPDIAMFGADYDTPDETCIRDYVHVSDLAEAHALALYAPRGDGEGLAANLGTGRGCSVREVIDTVGRVTGRPVAIRWAIHC